MSRLGAKAKRGELAPKPKRHLTIVEGRSCGECTECCDVLAVLELNKGPRERCAHQCEAGCAIYESRPASCAGWECLWRTGLMDESDRPDRSGVIVFGQRMPTYEGIFDIRATETRPGAIDAIGAVKVTEMVLKGWRIYQHAPDAAGHEPVFVFERIVASGSGAKGVAASPKAFEIMAKKDTQRWGIPYKQALEKLFVEIPNTIMTRAA